jgi:PilZ domain
MFAQSGGAMMANGRPLARSRLVEKRRQPRARMLKSARIIFNKRSSVIDCTVRNLSPNGACLNVASTLGIPEEFEVVFDADNSTRSCRVVWHKEKQLGVAFAR